MFGSAEIERPTLTNRETIFEEFQPMWSQSTNVTDRQTDRQTTCDRKTALCTLVHRAATSGPQVFSRTNGRTVLYPYVYRLSVVGNGLWLNSASYQKAVWTL